MMFRTMFFLFLGLLMSSCVEESSVKYGEEVSETQKEKTFAVSIYQLKKSGNDVEVLFYLPASSEAPEGGHQLYVNGAKRALSVLGSGRSIKVQSLDLSTKQCFRIESKYTQLDRPLYLLSNELCLGPEGAVCENKAPELTVNETSFSGLSGSSFNFTSTLKNKNLNCPDDTYALHYEGLPAGFSSDLNEQTLSSGGEKSFSVTMNTSTSLATGIYSATLVAKSGEREVKVPLSFNLTKENVSPPPPAQGDNEIDNDVNLAISDAKEISSSVREGEGRGRLTDVLYDPQTEDFVTDSQFAEYGVKFDQSLGLVSEDEGFYYQIEFNSLKNVNYITMGGAYSNQPQPNAMWKLLYLDSRGDWEELEAGKGGWIENGLLKWSSEHPVVAKAVKVVIYSDGVHELKSIHVTGKKEGNAKGVLVQYRGEEPKRPLGVKIKSAQRVGDDYKLTFDLLENSMEAMGGYNLHINGKSSNYTVASGERSQTVSGLDKSIQQCFKYESIYSDMTPMVYPISNQVCVSAYNNNNNNNNSNPSGELKAFPSAYGGGAYATGGRGGDVYHVTKLTDDGSEGTFRWALGQPRPATIVFDVSGIIQLQNSLTVNGRDLTVAGQTAPEGGITITMPPTGNIKFIFGNWQSFGNQIWRYIRIRDQFYGNGAVELMPGYGTLPGFSLDPNDYRSGENLMFDHLSVSWAETQCFGIRGQDTNNITMQNSILAECGRGALFGDTNYYSSKDNTFRNNVFYHVSHRTPNASSTGGNDVYNNVVYDWKHRLTVVKDGTKINHFNNYYFKGTQKSLSFSWNGVAAPRWKVNGITYARPDSHSDPFRRIEIFSKNNVIQEFYDGTQEENDKYIWMHHAGYLPDGTQISNDDQQKIKAGDEMFRNTPHPYVGSVPSSFLTAEQAKTVVPNKAGANKYLNADGSVGIFRDEPDQRYMNAIINDIPSEFSSTGSALQSNRHTARDSQSFANFQASISYVPINSRPADYDTDRDGMPDVWERATFGDLSRDGKGDHDGDGYTDLEEFLNLVDQ